MAGWNRADAKPVQIQGFAPDKDPLTAGIVLSCTNAIPTVRGFKALPSGVAVSNALPAPPLGATVAYYSDGSQRIVAGTASHLYSLDSGAWVRADGAQTFTATQRWRFTQFGDDLLAFSSGQIPQFALGPTGTFAVLGGLPDHAPLVVSVAGFVVLGDGTFWYSSAAGTDNNWTPSVQTLAATGALYDFPGPITAVTQILRNIAMFKGTAMWIGKFIGPPTTWQFDVVSENVGTFGQESVVSLSDSLAFLGTDDFYVCSGYAPQRIPNSPIAWFFDNADPARLANVLGRYDSINSVIWWHFQSPTAGTTAYDRYVAYNIRAQRWAGGTLHLASVPHPNSASFMNPHTMYYFDSSFILRSFTGAPLMMQLTTGYVGVPGQLSQFMGARLHYSETGLPTTLQCNTRHTTQIGRPDIAGPTGVPGADDWYNFRQTDRYHHLLLSTSGDAEVTGISYQLRPAGTR